MDVQARIAEILAAEAAAIAAVPVTPAFADAVAALEACTGKVLTTGMGKAGHVARKLAATLCSTALPAAFLHPGEALHGDLGLVGKGDVLIAFSNSGRTREVLEVIALGRRVGLGPVIGVTSHPESRLREVADVLLDMGPIHEPCRLGLTPTASIAVMLAIGDALALTVMERRGITAEDFGVRHHGGYLGEKVRGG
ncbi:SIS domain-containing protein [Myxococcota bacterium]|jgi:arabinose-5-phosphate isomerase|nr:SIS domain-containing protein [Myxococcota bacterium]